MRIDLVAKTLEGWSRLSPAQREKFFQSGLKAALRLGGPEFRRWLLRRVRTAPLAAPIDPACFSISDDMVALLKQLPPLKADDADVGTLPPVFAVWSASRVTIASARVQHRWPV